MKKYDIHQKEHEGWKWCHGRKKIFWDCKLKLRTFLWGHGEHEWPLGATVYQPEIF